VVIHASDNEPFGIVVIEAMALSKPVIATNTAGPSEVITHGENGILTPYGDANTLAKAALVYLDNRDMALEFGAAARRRALEFSTKRYADNVILAIKDLIETQSGGDAYQTCLQQ
jgi:glycosyltransferase involved in cell wall biosynthesis